MPNQPAEAFHCREYLRKSGYFTHERNQITTWKQIRDLLNGYHLDDVVNTVIAFTPAREASDVYTPPRLQILFDLDYHHI